MEGERLRTLPILSIPYILIIISSLNKDLKFIEYKSMTNIMKYETKNNLDTPMRCLCSRQLCTSASKKQKLEKITSILLALCEIVKNLFILE